MILYKVKVIQYFKFKYWDPQLIKSMASYSLPLIPNLMSWWAISSASKFIILHYMGAEGNGLYAVASRFPALLLVINSVLLLPLQDRILKEQDDVTFNRLLGKFIMFEMALAFTLGILSPVMTKILVSREYFETWQYMPYLYLGVGFNAIAGFLGLKYQKEKNTLKITLTTLLGAVVSIVLSIVLIQYIGLQGISISFLLGFLIVLLVRYIDIYKKDVFNLKFFIIIILPVISYLSILIIKKAISCF
jgi:O-antigen/teichoic acid export membrane protein